MSGEIPTLTAAERKRRVEVEGEIERALDDSSRSFVVIGQGLAEMRGEGAYTTRLYRETHETFEDYCKDRWGFSRVRSTQLISAAEVVTAVTKLGLPEPPSEYVARELVGLRDRPDELGVRWQRAIDAYPSGPTAVQVKEVVWTGAAEAPVRADGVEIAWTPQLRAEALRARKADKTKRWETVDKFTAFLATAPLPRGRTKWNVDTLRYFVGKRGTRDRLLINSAVDADKAVDDVIAAGRLDLAVQMVDRFDAALYGDAKMPGAIASIPHPPVKAGQVARRCEGLILKALSTGEPGEAQALFAKAKQLIDEHALAVNLKIGVAA